jgi:hypothetical protein
LSPGKRRTRLMTAQADEVVIHNTGQRLTAGWARQRSFLALYGSTPPTDILLATVAIAPAHGGGRAMPLVA